MPSDTISPREFESLTPEKDTVVRADDGQSYVLEVMPISGVATPETTGHTYANQVGCYKLSDHETPHIVEEFEAVFARVEAKHSVVGGLSRTPGDAFEVVVEVTDDDVDPRVDAAASNRATYHIPGDSEFAAQLEESLDSLANHLSEV